MKRKQNKFIKEKAEFGQTLYRKLDRKVQFPELDRDKNNKERREKKRTGLSLSRSVGNEIVKIFSFKLPPGGEEC